MCTPRLTLAALAALGVLTACGGGGGGGSAPISGSGPIPPTPATLSIKYTAPSYFLRGVAIAPLTPTTTASPTKFSITPALPAGLAIDTSSGVISGTPTGLSTPVTYFVTASDASGASASATVKLAVQTGNTYEVSVAATPVPGNSATLAYAWRSTDGVIQEVNAPQTTWIAPSGPGLHFVYVVVTDSAGGWAEGRIVLNTDIDGAPPFTPPPSIYQAPPFTLAVNNPGVLYVSSQLNTSATVSGKAATLTPQISAPGVVVKMTNTSANTVQTATSDAKGRLIFAVAPANGASTSYTCDIGLGPVACPFSKTGNINDTGALALAQSATSAYGHVQLNDGTFPGIREPFFGLTQVAQVSLSGCTTPSCAISVNAFGDFALPFTPQAGSQVTILSQTATATLPIPTDANTAANGVNFGMISLTGPLGTTGTPVISSITATVNGNKTGIFQSILPVLPSAAPSSKVPQADNFLSFSGTDSRFSACLYYQAIGAVLPGGCDAQGNYSKAVNFEDWKRTVQIDSYAPAGAPPTFTASYVNVVDLNLTRVHHSINYTTPAPGHVAAYVCNHLGPLDANNQPVTVNLPASTITPAQQTAVNAAVSAANANQLLVACVAMDYMSTPGVNGGKPFTRYLIFGPSGELLPSVNLDGRGEKFVPGTCVACHGGDNYAGAFPSDGTGAPDVGAHFLPYDTGNFAFSSLTGFTQAEQELAIFHLNQNILSTNVPINTVNLFNGWYASGTTLNQSYVPGNWTTTLNVVDPALSANVYVNVIAHNCRTCHAAIASYDLDSVPSYLQVAQGNVCGTGIAAGVNLAQSYTMPNALVTFNRFWNSAGSVAPLSPDLPALVTKWINSEDSQGQTPVTIPPCSLAPAL